MRTDQLELAVTMYRDQKASLAQVIKATGTSYRTVSRWLEEAGVEKRPRYPERPSREEVEALYYKGWSLARIAKEVRASRTTLQKCAKDWGLGPRQVVRRGDFSRKLPLDGRPRPLMAEYEIAERYAGRRYA